MNKFKTCLTALMGLVMVSFVNAQCVKTADGSGIQCQDLLAGQTILSGSVCVEVVGDDLVVSFATAEDWEIQETHVWVGSTLSDMPQTRKGNPKIGNFPYASGDITGAAGWSVSIPLTRPVPEPL